MISKSRFLDSLDKYFSDGMIEKKYYLIIKDFYFSYASQVDDINTYEELFLIFLKKMIEQIKSPYEFKTYHQKIRKPFDYYSFGLDFIKPLVKSESKALGLDNLKKMQKALDLGENIILFANHQTESDPQAISILLEGSFPDLASKIIYIAGERVITDPLAVPFSKGCDLLCIYSKNYIDTLPELKSEKQFHNKKTMNFMSDLLREGGKIIYVAPSGGRDRPNEKGEVEMSLFDPQSIEMFYLMAKKSGASTHFYPLALLTNNLLPPPDGIQIELGEKRNTKKAIIFADFGKEIDMENYPGSNTEDKISKRKNRANYIYSLVKHSYDHLRSL